ncbi:hypothetical protein MRS44_002683 [Fusarium solani]|uniref:uncharacterized protein n=1 Tax=Fusarium solani TaxID=169388 RepID=UPI0032C469FA|nr:hypothetical protein MRS44_002683 [Fusarium solani]
MTIDKIEKVTPAGVAPRGKVVVLNGFPGTGKLTILSNMQSRLAGQDTLVIDNHFIIDPQLRRVIFKEIRKMVDRGCVVLMTACLGNNEGDRKVLDEHLDIVRGTDIPMFWINIGCDQRTLEERLTRPERVQGNKAKLTSVEVLRVMTKHSRIILPSGSRHKLEDINLVTASLDVGGSIEEAVNKVHRIVEGKHSKL